MGASSFVGTRAALAALFIGVVPSARAAEPEPRHLLMISIDGLMPESYRAPELRARAPHLARLADEGAYARVVGVLPTVTYPSHTTLITGVPPRVHGIGANGIFDPLETSNGAWFWYAEDVRVPTLVTAAREGGLSTAAVSWPVSVGLPADVNLPEFSRSGSQHESDLKLLKVLSTAGLLDATARNRGRALTYPFTDEERVDVALHILKSHRPRLLLLHIFDLDDAEHDHGPGSPQALAALEKSDRQVGRILQALASAGLAARTALAIVSDHGFLPVSRVLKPNVLLREAGLIEVDAKGKITGWRAAFHVNGGSAGLRLRDPNDEDARARVRALLQERLAEPGSGLRAVLEPADIERFGGSADWLLALDARDGFYFSGLTAGAWSEPSASRGYHGYAPDRAAMHASFVVSAPGLTRRGDLGTIRMTIIAPTLARWLGVTLGPQADEPLPLFDEPGTRRETRH